MFFYSYFLDFLDKIVGKTLLGEGKQYNEKLLTKEEKCLILDQVEQFNRWEKILKKEYRFVLQNKHIYADKEEGEKNMILILKRMSKNMIKWW